ncbi:NAD(P)H-hydrate dehydratase [Nocardioides panacis]|uniref:ADP-dependent (S)-NAD(P)H-hydrate dehydratase n=1 Tax=Nocardioides panacis TaxID=2849501 RepID=A0A975SZ60_9ACTN|nr:NAD(P)H-hydrate dehydratase [Nocardioides panacis]
MDADLLRGWALPEPGSSKHSRGTALVVGGSRSTPGAVILAGESVLRAGGGKLQVATAESTAGQVSLALPEALVEGFPESGSGDVDPTACDDVVELAQGTSVTLLGPGLLDPGAAADLLEGIVPRLDAAVVIDALGSAYVTRNREGLRHVRGRCVLTLNHDELAKTLDLDAEDLGDDPVDAGLELAATTGAVVLYGGSHKLVLTPDADCFRITVGGPGLGVSGSGDVQAGLVTGLLARGAGAVQAAVWAAYLHGAAGDDLAEEVGHVGFLAREIPPAVPGLLSRLGG